MLLTTGKGVSIAWVFAVPSCSKLAAVIAPSCNSCFGGGCYAAPWILIMNTFTMQKCGLGFFILKCVWFAYSAVRNVISELGNNPNISLIASNCYTWGQNYLILLFFVPLLFYKSKCCSVTPTTHLRSLFLHLQLIPKGRTHAKQLVAITREPRIRQRASTRPY